MATFPFSAVRVALHPRVLQSLEAIKGFFSVCARYAAEAPAAQLEGGVKLLPGIRFCVRLSGLCPCLCARPCTRELCFCRISDRLPSGPVRLQGECPGYAPYGTAFPWRVGTFAACTLLSIVPCVLRQFLACRNFVHNYVSG